MRWGGVNYRCLWYGIKVVALERLIGEILMVLVD